MNQNNQGIIEEYEITPHTLMVAPINYGSKIYARIVEMEDEFISPFKPMEIIKKSCEFSDQVMKDASKARNSS
ncbi:competence protein ComK [Bacillaceae bacterium OS4b]|nr:competence protein ComK [Bacillaceae bacterium OS4b]